MVGNCATPRPHSVCNVILRASERASEVGNPRETIYLAEMQRGGDQLWRPEAVLTEDDIFTLPIASAGGDGAAEDYTFLALECIKDSELPDVFQTLQMGSDDVRDEDVLQEIMQAVNSEQEHSVTTHAGEEQMRCDQKVQERNGRPPRPQAKASSSNGTVRSVPSRRKKSSQTRHRRNPRGGRSWQDVEKERARLERMFAQRAALSTELYELHHFPSPYPNSMFKHPYGLPAPDMVFPVLNSSDFAPRAQQVTNPTQAPDFLFESPLPSPSSPELFITNSYSTLTFPPPPTPPTPPLADSFTTWIDPLEVSMAVLLQQDPTPAPVPFSLNPHPNPALYGAISGNKPRSANLHFTDSTVMTTMRIEDDDVQVLAVRGPGAANSISSPLFPENFSESTLLQLDVEELQAYLAHQGYNIAKPCVSHDDTQRPEQIEKDLDRCLDGDRAWLKLVEEEISRVLCEPAGS